MLFCWKHLWLRFLDSWFMLNLIYTVCGPSWQKGQKKNGPSPGFCTGSQIDPINMFQVFSGWFFVPIKIGPSKTPILAQNSSFGNQNFWKTHEKQWAILGTQISQNSNVFLYDVCRKDFWRNNYLFHCIIVENSHFCEILSQRWILG